MANDEVKQVAPLKALVSSYRDLHVWQQAMDLAEMCYRASRNFPKEELYGAVTQIRRSAASVPANIAEGNGREGHGEYVQFLRIAQGSLKELETHLLLSERVGLIVHQEVTPMLDKAEVVGKMLRSLIRSIQNKIGCNSRSPTLNSRFPTPIRKDL